MLKALELIGFKSFADKTRFEFPPGITVVVGPNGSGKSNIVDAIKWVLGAQSAKALRGQDMADVIFKGSSEGGRKMLNAAEATIIFDNSEKKLPVEATEVHITRRVYRSGEGEYLINGQPCRLKDIRDLFRGTGVGADAYSLIEQGKVDRMLQASAKDRRAMFEEAAGISRFKAKKIEAERRLERVQQNLLRLSDIVEEVESRLRSVRSQAGKAQRYREYSDRLQQLRTQVALTDWRRLAQRLHQTEAELRTSRQEAAEIAAETEAFDARALEVEVAITSSIESARVSENQLARIREQIAVLTAADERGRDSLRELETLAARHQRQLAAMTGRVGDLQTRLHETTRSLQDAQQAHDLIRDRLARHDQTLADLATELDRLRLDRDQHRAEHVEALRAASTLSTRISSLQSQFQGVRDAETRLLQRSSELEGLVSACAEELAQATTAEQALNEEADQKRRALESTRFQLADVRAQLDQSQRELNELRNRESSLRERARVLDELEKSHEGLAAGVREVLERAGEMEDGPFAEVQGLVADLFHVDVEIAPLVDVALGERAQHVVLSGEALLEEIQAGRYRPQGRVGFLRGLEPPVAGVPVDLSSLPGVLGRADLTVSCAPRHAGVKQRLLGDTWFVESLTIAVELQATAGQGCRFVTATGELLEHDGAVIVGPKLNAMGLVSRRSELRELHAQVAELASRAGATADQVHEALQTVESLDQAAMTLSAEHDVVSTRLADQQAQTRALRERAALFQRDQQALSDELFTRQTQQEALAAELSRLQAELVSIESTVHQAETALHQMEQQMEGVAERRDEHAQQATAAKVEWAKSEQRLESLRARMVQFEEDQRERERAIAESRKLLADSSGRVAATMDELLRSVSELALLYLQKDAAAAEIAAQAAQREQLSQHKAAFAGAIQDLRRRAQQNSARQHQHELSAGEIRHQQQTLADRLRDDYGIELATANDAVSTAAQQAREEVEQEIDELRRKINNIGAVNMEALNELDELEARFQSLSTQYQDLVQAQQSLERIIQKINTDSRRLFEETMEAIRVNFQTLYRKAFGGGRADLALEEGVDPLEAGVEIIATPPGKPSFSNSLLSGGEKALTAVALLLAIFQYRPSPFCVLDEVDAPFDEANIGRFVDVLRGFLDWTKFVIVTHSKKTMTAATTLYGVTMQESGVSKRVSVRFEDVSDDGHISQAAVDRSADGDERGAA